MESNAAAAAAAADCTADREASNTYMYEHLRALLSLENPTCQICTEDINELNATSSSNHGASCHDHDHDNTSTSTNTTAAAGPAKVRLVPMPHCKCRTTLASVHVRPADLPLPPPPADDINTAAATTEDQSNFLERLLHSQPCLSGGGTARHNKRQGAQGARFPFTPRRPPTATYHHRTTCTECLPRWTRSADDVQRYTYNDDPGGNGMCFTNDVRCAQCNRVFARRTVERLMTKGGGGGAGAGGSTSKDDDEWTKSVEHTAQVVRWADAIRAWAQREVVRARDAHEDGQPSSKEQQQQRQRLQLTPDQSHLRSVLLSLVRGGTAPSVGEDGVHRQEVQHGEVKRELMQRDPKFAQEVEDGEYVRRLAREEEAAAEEERRRRDEADERMARELAEKEGGVDGVEGNGSAAAAAAAAAEAAAARGTGIPTMVSSQQKQMRQREEEEKKSEELARRMQQEWEEEERRERDRREKRDAKLARKLYNSDKRDRDRTGQKRKGSSTVFGEPVRKSPFDSMQKQQPEKMQGDIVDITDSPTKATGDQSDDEYERIPPSSAAKMNEIPKTHGKREISEKEKDEVHDLVNGSNNNGDDDGDNVEAENEVDNNDDEPRLFTQATSPFPSPKRMDTSARKKPPPSSTPASNRPPMPDDADNATPRHRTGSHHNADFSADKKKEEDWDDGNDSDLQFLVDMGFDWKEAKSCYLDADKNVEKAAAMLSSATEEREKAKKKTRG